MGFLSNLFGAKKQTTASPGNLPKSYVVIDFETTGLSALNDEIIEIGAVRYSGVRETESFSTFVKPSRGIPSEVINLTGIKYSDVKDSPALNAVLPELLQFVGTLPLVAHNAPFDMRFLWVALGRCGLDMNCNVYDTLSMARLAFPGRCSYRLEDLKADLHLCPQTSHRAISDARTTAELFEKCRNSLKDYYPRKMSDICVNIDEDYAEPHRTWSYAKACDFTPSCVSSSDSPLYKKVVVFTGLFSVPMDDLMQAAVDAGATLWDRVTLKTDYLVEGKQDVTIVGPEGLSQKQIKARQYIAEGKKEIIILSENEFMQLINQ